MLTRRTPLKARASLRRKTQLRTRAAGMFGPGSSLKRTPPRHAKRKDTGFSPAVKLAVRTRAGHGDADCASCETCGRHLGRCGGQVHHRLNRQMGGSKLRDGIQNAGLLCGTPDDYSTCHGKATRLDAHLKAAGWVLDSSQDPALESVMLHDASGGGMTVWLASDGTYALTMPRRGAA
jgi:hypothetical protein